MKKFYILLVLCTSFIIRAQNYTIPKTDGDLVDLRTLWDGHRIYGYIEVHSPGKKEKVQNFTFKILDPEFKKISEGAITLKSPTLNQSHLGQCLYSDGKILVDMDEYVFGKSIYMNDSYVVIDVATGNTTPPKTFQDGRVVMLADFKPANPEYPVVNFSFRTHTVNGAGFLVNEVEKRGIIGLYKNAVMLDGAGEKLWENEKLPVESNDNFYEYNFLDGDKEVTILIAEYFKKRKSLSENLIILDSKTGRQLSFKPLSDPEYLLRYSKTQMVGEDFYLMGEYFKKNDDKTDKSARIEKKLGFYRFKINKKSGDILSKEFLPYSSMSQFADISQNGRIKKEGILTIKSFTRRPDGSSVVVAETYNPEALLAVNQYTEIYSILLSPYFKLERLSSSNVGNTAGSKYAYSQVLPDNSGTSAVFLDNDNKVISVNEIIYQDATRNFQTKKMEIDKKDEEKFFIPAKPGFVALFQKFSRNKKYPNTAEIELKKVE